MRLIEIPYHQTKSFSKFILDYISGDKSLAPFYNRLPKLENFKEQILEKQKQPLNRKVLVAALNQQYSGLETTHLVKDNIQSLAKENTFTVATGHQLCLFTGPLYFIYKIISTLNLAEKLKSEYSEYNFVPVYWMATEDHDFEEVNHVHLFGKKLEWNQDQKGGVGTISTNSLHSIFEELKPILGTSENAKELYSLLSEAYLNNSDLASATRSLVNALFSKYGLVVLDADTKGLKQQAIPLIKKDVLEQANHTLIESTNAELSKTQAFVRPINFFYQQKGSRNRIELQGGEYVVLNTNLKFTKPELEKEIENNPEHFSPNVLLRPLYKELLLPNLAMIGGGAEVNYWMQLKSTFAENSIVFPMLFLRNSALIIEDKSLHKIKLLGFEVSDFFASEIELHKLYVSRNTEIEISLNEELKQIEDLYNSILSKTIDKGLQKTISAEKQKQLNTLAKIEQKLTKSEKQKHQVKLAQISQLKNKLFPSTSLQERYDNIIPFYLLYGNSFVEHLKAALNPLDQHFSILIQD